MTTTMPSEIHINPVNEYKDLYDWYDNNRNVMRKEELYEYT